MTYRGIIFGLMLISCCAEKSNSDNSVADSITTDKAYFDLDSVKTQLSDNQSKYYDFKAFLKKFSSDSVFQISRVRFPFATISTDIEDNKTTNLLNEEEWSYIDLQYDSSSYFRKIDAYEQIVEINSNKAKVGYRGIDNGIYFDYFFERSDSLWQLIRYEDYSN